MICNICRSIADHPSNVNENLKHCEDPGCSCRHIPTTGPVEKLFDGNVVDIEWVRTRRTINYSKQEMEP